MSWDERVDAVAAQARGVTDRQAAFLVTVMLHAGVCMDRHYCTFAHIAHGQKTTDFFRRLVDRGYATAHSCRNNSARVFHIQYKPLYAAIGDPDSRHRKPTPLARIFILEHGHGNVLTRLSPSQAVAELFARSFVPFHRHEYVDSALDFLQELVGAVGGTAGVVRLVVVAALVAAHAGQIRVVVV